MSVNPYALPEDSDGNIDTQISLDTIRDKYLGISPNIDNTDQPFNIGSLHTKKIYDGDSKETISNGTDGNEPFTQDPDNIDGISFSKFINKKFKKSATPANLINVRRLDESNSGEIMTTDTLLVSFELSTDNGEDPNYYYEIIAKNNTNTSQFDKIYYYPVQNPPPNASNRLGIRSEDSNEKSFTLTGLLAYNEYEIKIISKNVSNEQSETQTMTERTYDNGVIFNTVTDNDKTPLSVRFSWNTYSTMSNVKYKFRVTSTYQGNPTEVRGTLDININEYEAISLEINQLITFEVYVVDSDGSTRLSLDSITSERTLNVIPPTNISITVGTITSDTIDISWTTSGETGEQTIYFDYELSKNSSFTSSVISKTNVTDTSVDYTGITLERFTDYYFRITGRNEHGGIISGGDGENYYYLDEYDVPVGKTLSDTPSFTISCSPDLNSIEIVINNIDYGGDSGGKWEQKTQLTTYTEFTLPSDNKITVLNLAQDYTYTIYIRYTSSLGSPSYETSDTVKTLSPVDAPTFEIILIEKHPIEFGTIIIELYGEDDGGETPEFEIQYRDTEWVQATDVEISWSTLMTYTLSGLNDSTGYRLMISATNSGGTTTVFQNEEVFTKLSRPEPPVNLTNVSVYQKFFHMQWEKPPLDNNINAYNVVILDQNDDSEVGNFYVVTTESTIDFFSSNYDIDLDKINLDALYDFKVSSLNGDSASDFASEDVLTDVGQPGKPYISVTYGRSSDEYGVPLYDTQHVEFTFVASGDYGSRDFSRIEFSDIATKYKILSLQESIPNASTNYINVPASMTVKKEDLIPGNMYQIEGYMYNGLYYSEPYILQFRPLYVAPVFPQAVIIQAWQAENNTGHVGINMRIPKNDREKTGGVNGFIKQVTFELEYYKQRSTYGVIGRVYSGWGYRNVYGYTYDLDTTTTASKSSTQNFGSSSEKDTVINVFSVPFHVDNTEEPVDMISKVKINMKNNEDIVSSEEYTIGFLNDTTIYTQNTRPSDFVEIDGLTITSTSSNIVFSWTNAASYAYEFSCETNDDTGSGTTLSTDTSLTFSTLTRDSIYDIVLDDINFKKATDPEIPGVISDILYKDISTGTVIFDIILPANYDIGTDNETVTGNYPTFHIEIHDNSSYNNEIIDYNVSYQQRLGVLISTLSSFTEYYIRVKVSNKAGSSAWTNASESFTTRSAPPPIPKIFEIVYDKSARKAFKRAWLRNPTYQVKFRYDSIGTNAPITSNSVKLYEMNDTGNSITDLILDYSGTVTELSDGSFEAVTISEHLYRFLNYDTYPKYKLEISLTNSDNITTVDNVVNPENVEEILIEYISSSKLKFKFPNNGYLNIGAGESWSSSWERKTGGIDMLKYSYAMRFSDDGSTWHMGFTGELILEVSVVNTEYIEHEINNLNTLMTVVPGKKYWFRIVSYNQANFASSGYGDNSIKDGNDYLTQGQMKL